MIILRNFLSIYTGDIMSGILGLLFGVLCIICAIVLLVLKKDTKTVLLGAGIIMCIAALKPIDAFDAFKDNMIQTGLITSVCSVMGFSFVMKITQVDKHLVHALAKVLVKIRPLLIPGVIISTFIVNISLNSASGVTAAVGTIFIPLLISMGVKPAMAASAVILGTWGSMLSPGLDHQSVISKIANVEVIDVIKVHAKTDITVMIIAAIYLTILAKILKEDKGYKADNTDNEDDNIFKVNPFYAILPLLPVIMLLTFNISSVQQVIPWASRIGVPHAMLIGSILCIFATRTDLQKATNEFFNGMGKGYADIIGIIISASVFVSGMKALGLLDFFINSLKTSTHLVPLAATYGPFFLGVITGSGDSSAIVFNQSVTVHAESFGYEIVNMGSLAALAGALGRAASPIAGATIIAAGIANISPFEIAKRTGPGVFIASIVAMIMLI